MTEWISERRLECALPWYNPSPENTQSEEPQEYRKRQTSLALFWAQGQMCLGFHDLDCFFLDKVLFLSQASLMTGLVRCQKSGPSAGLGCWEQRKLLDQICSRLYILLRLTSTKRNPVCLAHRGPVWRLGPEPQLRGSFAWPCVLRALRMWSMAKLEDSERESGLHLSF